MHWAMAFSPKEIGFSKKKKSSTEIQYTNSKPIKKREMSFIAKYTQDWYPWQTHNACCTEKPTNSNTEGHKIIVPLGLLDIQ